MYVTLGYIGGGAPVLKLSWIFWGMVLSASISGMAEGFYKK